MTIVWHLHTLFLPLNSSVTFTAFMTGEPVTNLLCWLYCVF